MDWSRSDGEARFASKSIDYSTESRDEECQYRKNVKNPDTAFSLRANSKKREPEIQDFWEKNEIFKTIAKVLQVRLLKLI